MSSRLDRLFILLESGGSAVTRRAAAKQLGDAVKGQAAISTELQTILERLIGLLFSKSWDTRVAVAAAIGAVLDNVPKWDPQPVHQKDVTTDASPESPCVDVAASVATVCSVLNCGHQLRADHDTAYATEQDPAVDISTRLKRERQLLNQKLGLDVAETLGLDTSSIFSNDDLLPRAATTKEEEKTSTMPELLLPSLSDDRPHCTAASQPTEQGEHKNKQDCGRPHKQARPSVTEESNDGQETNVTADVNQPLNKCDEWPLQWVCHRLARELFSGCWETRHGAATALRELLARHGDSGGKKEGCTQRQLFMSHQRWVWAVCLRLVCVLALDSFGDYLADQVVAPVRETVAQALGVSCVQLHAPHVVSVVQLLRYLVQWRGSWTTRHGGLLGLKYTLAARADLRGRLLGEAYRDVYNGLLDETDDVVGVAAECLTVCCDVAVKTHPKLETGACENISKTEVDREFAQNYEKKGDVNTKVLKMDCDCDVGSTATCSKHSSSTAATVTLSNSTDSSELSSVFDSSMTAVDLLSWLSQSQLQQLLGSVWSSLLHVDDLSACTPALLLLLASLVRQHGACNTTGLSGSSLRDLVPRVFPFLYHASSSVRRSALTTLAALTAACKQQPKARRKSRNVSDSSDRNGSSGSRFRGDYVDIFSESPLAIVKLASDTNNSSQGCVSTNSDKPQSFNKSNPSIISVTCEIDVESISCTDSSVINSSNKTLGNSMQKTTTTGTPSGNDSLTCLSIDSDNVTPQIESKDSATTNMSSSSGDPVLECDRSSSSSLGEWCEPIMTPLLRHLYQRSLVETSQLNLSIIEQCWCAVLRNSRLSAVLMSACPLVSTWLALAATPAGTALDLTLLLQLPSLKEKGDSPSVKSASECVERVGGSLYSDRKLGAQIYVGGGQHCKRSGVVMNRICATRLLGELSLYVSEAMPGAAYQHHDEPLLCYTRLLLVQLNSRSAQQRSTAASVVRHWAMSYTRHYHLRQREQEADAMPAVSRQYLCECPLNASSSSALHELQTALLNCLTQAVYYDEIAVSFTRLQQDTKDFLSLLKHYGLEVKESYLTAPVLTLDQMSSLVQGTDLLQQLHGNSQLRVKLRHTLEMRRHALLTALLSTTDTQETLARVTRSQAAGALVRLGALPAKLNPIVKPLIDTIKLEENKELQSDAGRDLALLLDLCAVREKSPNVKIIKNLAAFLCVDGRHTPQIIKNSAEVDGNYIQHEDKYSGIYFLRTVDDSKSDCPQPCPPVPPSSSEVHGGNLPSSPYLVKRKRGRPSAKHREQFAEGMPQPIVLPASVSQEQRKLYVQRRGCSAALQHIVQHFGERLFTLLPVLCDMLLQSLLRDVQGTGDAAVLDKVHSTAIISKDNNDQKKGSDGMVPLNEKAESNMVSEGMTRSQDKEMAGTIPNVVSPDHEDVQAQETVNWLQLLEAVLPVLPLQLLEKVQQHLPALERCLYHRYCGVRHMTGRVFAALVSASTGPVMAFLLTNVLPALKDHQNVVRRQGAVECLHLVVEEIKFRVLPYVVLLIVPLLGSSSDSNASVRSAGSQVFASLIRLLPLDGFMPDPPHLTAEVSAMRDQHRDFLRQLMDGRKAHHYNMPVTINATLREYQQSGVNWLAFLRDYGVHGILCDDMGLGKTLQTICILASTHYEYCLKENKLDTRTPRVQSLVVCPPTLTGHWVYEVERFAPASVLQPLQYAGSPSERTKLRQSFFDHNLIVASYDIVRNEISFFEEFKWLYIILDEGHVIKNTKTKSYQAIKRLSGQHRVILSGTPIQNNVLELWSLFDFLMPGYLGTERQFNTKYARPILASRDIKASPAEQEAGVVAMDALHRQALPFMMRRLKEHVLQELPPKITQDYYCELSSLQKLLYEDFLLTQGSDLDDEDSPKTHVFQALQYLRLVCNHPALVLRPQHPRYHALLQKAKLTPLDLHNITLAAKLPALRSLLLECGIGNDSSAMSDIAGGGGDVACLVAPHRVLVFCQLRTMIDIIEKDLLKKYMPSVTYLRLDGSVPANMRYGLVQRFNQDPSIDLMLLTTQVGGLGLNLTAADTVVFVEHDWNPMKDLQAMDRAHRIGQKCVVNVYRLITRNTLEEKIMGLQKFKLHTANTVISPENGDINSMGTEQILELFSLESGKDSSKRGTPSLSAADGSTYSTAPKAVLESLPELWDQSQYHDEYDIDKFLAAINK